MEQRLNTLDQRRAAPLPQAGTGGVILVLILGLGVSFFYAALKARFSGLGYFPDVLVPFTVWVALKGDLPLAATGVFLQGFFLDGLTLAPSGVMPLELVLIVLVVKLLARVLEFSSTFYIMCLNLFVFSLSNLVIYPLLIYISYGNLPFDIISHYFSIYCTQGVLTAIVAPAIFWFLDALTLEGE